MNSLSKYSLPFNKKEVEKIVESIIYDLIFSQPNKENTPDQVKSYFIDILNRIVPEEKANFIAEKFFDQLEDIKTELEQLILIFFNNDPASKSEIEIIVSYPGFFAIAVHRLANTLYKLDTPILPRFFAEYAHKQTGIDIHPGASIGKNFYIDHGTGIVIGETTIIGNNVKIYQGVTLGAFYVSKDLADQKRHPTIEDNVTIYAGATILGGTTVIGANSTIGGNVWITKSVPPDSIAYQEFQPIIKQKNNNQSDDFYVI
ncbi:serine O-acetyltransferase EpsC [Faecalibacter bovis]|uniref:Serine acetyltransferase n=1 Tax=Faecalibacter bovis TaxID=2898187 RepID=A0ABX7XFV0_9FLAO|nr:serine O-acetyltransferase EpsC [Faecalibacter bovis]QTV06837.1 serine acetyltransferase [Faecalibacter bovis]